LDKLLYGPDGRLLYKNGTLVTDAFGAPCCGCGGSECNPASLVFGPCEYPCNNAAGYQWAFQSSPGVYTEPTPTAVPSCQRCCDIFKDVPNGWTTTEQQFFVDRSAQGDIYYFSSRSEIVRRYSSHPHTLYVSIAEFLTECRRSSGCVSINSFNAQTTFPPANPEPGLYCTIGYAGAPINSWGPELPNYVCGPPNTGYTCAANGSFDCQTGSTRHVVAQDSGTSYIAFGRSNTLRLYAGCNGTSSCCCAGTCYGNVVSGCPGPVFYPGQSNCAGVPCFVRPPTGACCVQGSCLGNLLASECAALSGSFHLGRDCRNVLCGIAIGSCCLPDGSCANTPESECLSIGGIWNGPGTTCAATICPVIPTGACCTPIGCVGGLTQSQCLAQGGTGWFQGQACTPNLCGGGSGPGACCSLGGGGRRICTIEQTREACEALNGGMWLGSGTTCDPDPCDQIQTNPFNPITPQQMASRIIVPGRGCSGCGNGIGL